MQYKILFVDDESANLRLLERLFRNKYEVHTASSADEAIKVLEVHDVALIISDQRMPSMTGSEFLKIAAEMRPQTVRIMLTGYTDANDLVEAINSGVVYKYLTKPWMNDDLQMTVKRALQHYETTKAQRQLQLKCERLQTQLMSMRDGFVDVFLQMLDARLPGASEHAERTAALADRLGERCGIEYEERELISLAAHLHDVAQFCTPEGKWLNRAPKNGDELELACREYDLGVQMLEKIPGLAEAARLLRFRFENFDGTGQPFGFTEEEIPIGARVLAVAEAYDRLRFPQISNAVCISHRDAAGILGQEVGRRFDPAVIRALEEVELGVDAAAEIEVPVPA